MSILLSPADERDLTQFLCDEVGARLLLSDVAADSEPLIAEDPIAALPRFLPGPSTFGLHQVHELAFWLPDEGPIRTMRDAAVPNSAAHKIANLLTKEAAGSTLADVVDFTRTPSLRLQRSKRMSHKRWAPGQFQSMPVRSSSVPYAVARIHAKALRWLKMRGTKTDPFSHCPEVAERRPKDLRAFWVWVQPDAQLAVNDGVEIWPWNA